MKNSTLSKTLALSAASLMLFVTACNSPTEKAAETKADAMEDKADMVRDAAETKADAMENKADVVRDKANK